MRFAILTLLAVSAFAAASDRTLDDIVVEIKYELDFGIQYLKQMDAKVVELLKNPDVKEIDRKVLVQFGKLVAELEAEAKKLVSKVDEDAKKGKEAVRKGAVAFDTYVIELHKKFEDLANTEDLSEDGKTLLNNLNLLVKGVDIQTKDIIKQIDSLKN